MMVQNCDVARERVNVPMPDKVCFVELKQLDSFVQQLNACRHCATPGCSGDLSVKTSGLGGAVCVTFLHGLPYASHSL